MNNKLRLYVMTALMAALAVVGSVIKVPGFITTAALDSAPAFLSVVFLPPVYSGFAALLGHFATAYTSGMPLGAFHLLIAIEMFIVVYIFNNMHQKGWHVFKWPVLVVLNGIVSPLPFYFLMSPAFYFGALPSLLIATIINVIVVMLLMPLVKPIARRAGWTV